MPLVTEWHRHDNVEQALRVKFRNGGMDGLDDGGGATADAAGLGTTVRPLDAR
jgi:hypothetical protein